jgi:hypothetical protein
VATLVKLLLFNLSTYFSVDSIFSSTASIGKLACFKNIVSQSHHFPIFPGVVQHFIVIGDGAEEEEACALLKRESVLTKSTSPQVGLTMNVEFEFYHVNCKEDLTAFRARFS